MALLVYTRIRTLLLSEMIGKGFLAPRATPAHVEGPGGCAPDRFSRSVANPAGLYYRIAIIFGFFCALELGLEL